MLRAVVFLICMGSVVACAKRDERLTFDGQHYRSKVSRVDKNYQEITVSASPVSASFEGARAAAVHEATRYCVLNFGTSEIDWTIGPDQDASSYVFEKDTLVLQGTCAQ